MQLLAACKSRATCEIQSPVPATLHKLEHFFTLSHTLPLHDFHLNTGLLIAKIQANLARNKARSEERRVGKECGELLKCVQRSRDSRLDLAGASWLQAARMMHTYQACQKLKSRDNCCTTGQKSQAGQAVYSRLELMTQPSCEVTSLEHHVWEKLTFHIPSHPTIYIPLYPRFRERFQREF